MATIRIGYSDAIAQRILDELDRGRRLSDICRDDGMPSETTVHRWARRDMYGFAERYARSRPPIGGPVIYTPALAERICDELRTGRTLHDLCAEEGMPADSTVLNWMKTDRDGFRARYWRAREIGYLAMADEIIAIADDGRNDWMDRQAVQAGEAPATDPESVARSRLRITARCWLLSKMLPRLFGNRLSVETVHEAGDSLRALLQAIDGRTRGLPAAAPAGRDAASGKARCCPHCGGRLG
jgi:hypothetical protein